MKDEIINLVNKDTGFINRNDFQIEELNENRCILKYKIKKDGLNPMGIVHGGILFGLSDTAAGTAAGLLSSMDGRTPLTTSASINFLNPAKDDTIYAEAVMFKKGKKIGYFEVKVRDTNNTLISTSFINFCYK